jgi:hypothetical protein
MKRSEMLKVIEDAIYCHITPGTNLTCVAETVLQSIEGGNKTGIKMLPDSFRYIDDEGYTPLEKVLFELDITDLGYVGWEDE